MQVKLAEALLRRKELEAKVKQLATIKMDSIFQTIATRKSAHEGIDDVIAKVAKLEANQVTAEYDHYARQLRLCDAAIQQMNWTVVMNEAEKYMTDFKKQIEEEGKKTL